MGCRLYMSSLCVLERPSLCVNISTSAFIVGYRLERLPTARATSLTATYFSTLFKHAVCQAHVIQNGVVSPRSPSACELVGLVARRPSEKAVPRHSRARDRHARLGD